MESCLTKWLDQRFLCCETMSDQVVGYEYYTCQSHVWPSGQRCDYHVLKSIQFDDNYRLRTLKHINLQHSRPQISNRCPTPLPKTIGGRIWYHDVVKLRVKGRHALWRFSEPFFHLFATATKSWKNIGKNINYGRTDWLEKTWATIRWKCYYKNPMK